VFRTLGPFSTVRKHRDVVVHVEYAAYEQLEYVESTSAELEL
jgi:hypothetical protein